MLNVTISCARCVGLGYYYYVSYTHHWRRRFSELRMCDTCKGTGQVPDPLATIAHALGESRGEVKAA